MVKIDLKKRLLREFEKLPAPLKKQPVFLGVSSGMDSSVLAHVVLSLRDRLPPIHFIHVNYHLRTPDSDHEEAFLTRWAAVEGIPFHVKRLHPKKKPKNLQAWARGERYGFFSRVIAGAGRKGGMLWLAHHQRDQAETILDRLIRGSGLKGLAGMKELEEISTMPGVKLKCSLRVFRPFLQISHETLTDYSKRKGISHRLDASNEGLDYRRNRIRLQILPLLKRENPEIEASISRLGLRLREAHESLSTMAERWLVRHKKGRGDKCRVPWTPLRALTPAVRDKVLEQFIRQTAGAHQAWDKILPASARALHSARDLQIIPLKDRWALELDPKKDQIRMKKRSRPLRVGAEQRRSTKKT
jgi:tRNA(Ile)-lysidine synthase